MSTRLRTERIDFDKPPAPTNLSLVHTAGTITISFTKNTDTDIIHEYEIWRSNSASTGFELIHLVEENVVSSFTSYADTKYNKTGTVYYKVYGVRGNKRSTALSGSVTFATPVSSQLWSSNFSLVNLAGSAATHVGLGTFSSYNPITGVILQVTRAAAMHSGTGALGAAHFRKSTDGGANWSSWTNLTPSGGGLLKANITYDFRNHWGGYITKGPNAGRFLLFYEDHNNAGASRVTYLSWTDDDGDNWTLGSPFTFRSGKDALLNVGKNNILEWDDPDLGFCIGVPVYEYDAAPTAMYSVGLLISTDNGATFTTYRLIDVPFTTRYSAEPSVLHLGGGTFLMIARDAQTSSHTGGNQQYISYDYCKTWTYMGLARWYYNSAWTGTQTISNTDHALMPSLHWINCLNQRRLIAMPYLNRLDDKLYIVFGDPVELAKSGGQDSWNGDSFRELETYTGQNSGNGSSLFIEEGMYAIYSAEKQSSSSSSVAYGTSITLDVSWLASIFSVNPNNSNIIYGTGEPKLVPQSLNAVYVDLFGKCVYIPTGTLTVDDWTKASANWTEILYELDKVIDAIEELDTEKGDMTTTTAQTVTGVKTFESSKAAVKGSSTGITTIASANDGATDYIVTLPKKTGTAAYTDDLHSHSNSAILDKISESNSKPTYNSSTWPVTISEDTDFTNYSILRKSIPSADNKGEGDIVTDINAGETLAFPTLVYLNTSGTWSKADPNAIASTGLLGMALESKTSGQALKVLLRGFVRDDDWNWRTVGGAIFANAGTAGTYTQTAPSGEDDVVVIVGWATHADRMYFCPDNTRIEFRAS